MRNPSTDFNRLLSTFTYEEQINEINQKIYEFLNEKQYGNMIDTRYEQIKELKHMKIKLLIDHS